MKCSTARRCGTSRKRSSFREGVDSYCAEDVAHEYPPPAEFEVKLYGELVALTVPLTRYSTLWILRVSDVVADGTLRLPGFSRVTVRVA